MACARAAAQGKRCKADVAAFEYRLGERVLALQQRLARQTWHPQPYRHFALQESKRRWISAAPFEDRVVHHALVRVLEPRFERCFIGDSFANRVGKGTHLAVARLRGLSRQHPWVLRMDVRQHFASIDHALLQACLFARVPEPGLRRLITLIIGSGAGIHDQRSQALLLPGDDLLALARPRGLPIGNLSSQFWSNCYLDSLDQFVKRTLRVQGYLRYVDDFALFGHDRRTLAAQGERVKTFLAQRLRLQVHEAQAQVQPTAAGTPWLGFVVGPERTRVKGRKVVEAHRCLAHWHGCWQRGECSFAELDARVQGWLAHVAQADSWHLRERVLAGLPLTRP